MRRYFVAWTSRSGPGWSAIARPRPIVGGDDIAGIEAHIAGIAGNPSDITVVSWRPFEES